METLVMAAAIGFIVWGGFAMDYVEKRPFTDSQKHKIRDTLIMMMMIFGPIVGIEFGVIYFLGETYFENTAPESMLLSVLLFNMALFYFIPEKKENNKTIEAKQLSNFGVSPQKFWNFKNLVKEVDIDREYYHLRTIHNKSDMTIIKMALGEATPLEYKMLLRELEKPFELHIVYTELINYINQNAKKYNIRPLQIDKLKGLSRGRAETEIFHKIKELRDAKIPIRISQLLQISKDRKYLFNFIYFLMCIESKQIVSNAVIYYIYITTERNKK